MNETIVHDISDRLCKIGKELGLHKMRIRSSRWSTKIYLINNHALQIEIDWRENDLLMYVVYLNNKSLPNESVIYRYSDGHWCRKFLEDVYKVKHPQEKDKNRRYSTSYLYDCFDFYVQLISKNPDILTKFDCTGSLDYSTGDSTGDASVC